ncbi:zf-BED domain-containing protein [Cephalotus follicularis]|uniref:Zf-BED domain-containing protein n=1 Tax=Cephalotus follicularis TaxID=3775 RepID=A0A1Q3D5I5_CEPFO|nr:zf-BED domain-containing protein [Cephalotus follicularis]
MDSAWRHGERVDDSRVRCNYCRHEMCGITRLKQHLAHIGNNVIPCSKCPVEVTLEFKEPILNKLLDGGERKRKSKRKIRDHSSRKRKKSEADEEEHGLSSHEGWSSDDVDREERALIKQAMEESLQMGELEMEKSKREEADLMAACRASEESYRQELQGQGEGCSRYKGGSSYAGYDSNDIDFGSSCSDFSF